MFKEIRERKEGRKQERGIYDYIISSTNPSLEKLWFLLNLMNFIFKKINFMNKTIQKKKLKCSNKT